MAFSVPDGTTEVTVTGKAQDPSKQDQLVISGSYDPDSDMAYVDWVNLGEEDISFDYKIEPKGGDGKKIKEKFRRDPKRPKGAKS